MTLLIAGVDGSKIWMIADTAITNPRISLRDREYMPKIQPINNNSLIGFAGDVDSAASAIQEARKLPSGDETLKFLLERHKYYRSVDFAYAFTENQQPHLFLIANGRIESRKALNIGNKESFQKFQPIRHKKEIDHAPDAIHQFMCGINGSEIISEHLIDAIIAMITLFASDNERGVGGWPVPYQLSENGVMLVTYAYGVTDPIVNDLKPGVIIPHGSAEAGGFGLSFTELREGDGMVIYWLQKPGGHVLIRDTIGYKKYEFEGTPEVFKTKVKQELGRDVDLWFSNQEHGQIKSIKILNDELGRPRFLIAYDGERLSYSWFQSTPDSFRVSDTLLLNRGNEMPVNKNSENTSPWNISVSDDQGLTTITLHNGEENSVSISVTAAELDKFIMDLARVRMSMADEVPHEISSGTSLEAIINPAWRTRPLPHPAISGPLLCLRHPGFGWLGFILPNQEAINLGQWLVNHVTNKSCVE